MAGQVRRRAAAKAADYEYRRCSWCRALNDSGRSTCEHCGAPLDEAAVVTESGWRAAPRLRDHTSFHALSSTCEVEGEIVPVAEFNLGSGDGLFFEHHCLLWKEPAVALGAHRLGGGIKRMLGGMPYMITTATGPGRLAFSRDSAGELVVLPLEAAQEIDVREHAFLVATAGVHYDFVRIEGVSNVVHGGGLFMDRFVASAGPGLLLLHGSGNVFERTLAEGESLFVEPGAFLYKERSVSMQVDRQAVRTSIAGHRLFLARMTGPGRLGIQSMYHRSFAGSDQ